MTTTDDNELFEETDESTNDDAANDDSQEDKPEEVDWKALAEGMSVQFKAMQDEIATLKAKPVKADEEEEELPYDPEAINNRSVREAGQIANMVAEAVDEIAEEYPELSKAHLKSLRAVLIDQPAKNLKNVLANKQHMIIADSYVGRMVKEGKLKVVDAKPLKTTGVGSQVGGAKQNAGFEAHVKDTEKKMLGGKTMSARGRAELMKAYNGGI